MATWLHPATAHLQALANAAAQHRRRATVALPPMPRHRVHVLSKQNPQASQSQVLQKEHGADTERMQETRSNALPEDDVVRILRQFHHDRTRRVPLRTIARAAGLHRVTVYRVMWSGKASEATCAALTPILERVAAGTLAYRRRGQQWEEIELHQQTREGPPLLQDRMVRAAEWRPGQCRSCAGSRYTEVTVHGTRWFLCDTCLPWQTAGIGAQPVYGRGMLPRKRN